MVTKIYSNKTLIGTTDLRIIDDSMGVLSGEFIPNEDYSRIRESVWKFNSKNDKDFDLWNSLRLNVQLGNGYFIYPIGGISIGDVRELKKEKIDIEIAGVFSHVIDDYFKTDPSSFFVEEPWEGITIDQKIAFENELMKEIGKEKGLIKRLIGSKKKHIMAEYNFSALCTSCRNDEVLFSIHSDKHNDYDFALVHLTWKQKQEDYKFPRTQFYKSFDDFKSNKMTPDKVDWEE